MKKNSKGIRAGIWLLLWAGLLSMSGCSMRIGRETLEKDVLRVGMHLDIDQMCYLSAKDNQPEGFEVELAGLLAEKMGMELEIVDTSRENLLKSLDGEVYDCVLSSVAMSQWNTIHYGHTRPYLELPSAEEEGGNREDSRIAAFTRKGSPLKDTLEENLEELKEDGTLTRLSDKYFGKDLTA